MAWIELDGAVNVRDLGGLLLDKPFTPQDLRAAVRELFEGLPPC